MPSDIVRLLHLVIKFDLDMIVSNWYICVSILVLLFLLSKPFVWFCRKSAYWGRTKLSEEEIERLFGDDEKSMLALRFLAKAYDVPLGFLRPDDVFTKEGRLWKYDAWTYGRGQEIISDYLQSKGLTLVSEKWTVSDFVNWYAGKIPHKTNC